MNIDKIGVLIMKMRTDQVSGHNKAINLTWWNDWILQEENYEKKYTLEFSTRLKGGKIFVFSTFYESWINRDQKPNVFNINVKSRKASKLILQ